MEILLVGVSVFSWGFEVVAGRGRGEEENWGSGGRACLCGTGRRKKRLKKAAGVAARRSKWPLEHWVVY